MKIYVYPSDRFGCGMFRMAWPGNELKAAGYDVKVVDPAERWGIGIRYNVRTDEVQEAFVPDDADVIVMQRVTHKRLVEAIPIWRRQGTAVVVDVDDDLSCVHPSNPAYAMLAPRGGKLDHTWHNLSLACRNATLVTVTSEALARRYGNSGSVRVIPNYLPENYFTYRRKDSTVLGWPAAIDTHPNDPTAVGSALSRLLSDMPSANLHVIAKTTEVVDLCRRAFRLPRDPIAMPPTTVRGYPMLLAALGVAVTPLADTKFNEAKSWLKPLELSATGVPWVGSPRAEYARFHRESGAGVMADRPQDWYRELKRLLTDEPYRLEMSEKARAAAEAYRLRDHAWRWMEAWTTAYELQTRL